MQEKRLLTVPNLSIEEKSLLDQVDASKDLLVELVKNLIAIDSRVYSTELFSDQTEIFTFVSQYMENRGFNSEMIKVPHISSTEQQQLWPNLITKYEFGSTGKKLQFMGHLDVVPFTIDSWDKDLSPLEGTIKNGKLYGRGANDMKGGIAALMLAMEILKASNLLSNGTIQMWNTPDEELNGDYGARFMTAHYLEKVQADATIIGEPTAQSPIINPAIIVGEKGVFWLKLLFFGASGHGSLPKPKSNAINKAIRFINNIKNLKIPKGASPFRMRDLLKAIFSRFRFQDIIKILSSGEETEKNRYDEDGLPLNAFFNTTISFNQICTKSKVNIIPDQCEVEMDMRILPKVTTQQIINALSRYATSLGYRIEFPREYSNSQINNKKMLKRLLDIHTTILSEAPGNVIDTKNAFCQLLARTFEEIYHVKNIFFFAPGASDATHLRKFGIPNVVLFGPSGTNAHGSNESVEIDQLIMACKCYVLMAYRFLTS